MEEFAQYDIHECLYKDHFLYNDRLICWKQNVGVAYYLLATIYIAGMNQDASVRVEQN